MNPSSLPMVDIAVFAIVLFSALFAMMRGFTNQVLSIGAWAVSIAAAVFGLPVLRPHFRAMISNHLAADAVVVVALFIGTMIVTSIIVRAISAGVRVSILSPLDRALGFAYGIVRGALLVVLAYIVMTWMLDLNSPPSWMRSAKTTPWIVSVADVLKGWAPSSLYEVGVRAKSAQRTAEDTIEIQKTVKTWSAPTPQQPAPEAPEGYAEDQRREMNRLIDTNH